MALTLAFGFQSCGDDGDVDEPAAPSPEPAVDSTSNTPSQPVSNPDSTGNADKPADLLPISFTVNGVDFEMAPIPGGKYQELDYLGEVTATHEIQPFYMMTTGCTQALWAAVMGCNPSKDFGSGKCIGDNYPVNNVSWSDVAGDVDFNKTVYSSSFVAALNKLLGKNFRLTTRAEWMWAARGGDAATLYSGTSNVDELADYAWIRFNGEDNQLLHEVAGKMPNCFGLFDMTGNVSEWCADEGAFNSHPGMGGSVYDDAEICLISRGATYESLFTIELGFRLVLPI